MMINCFLILCSLPFSDEPAEFMYTHLELCIVSLFVALILIIIFIFLESARFRMPTNWILALLIVSITMSVQIDRSKSELL